MSFLSPLTEKKAVQKYFRVVENKVITSITNTPGFSNKKKRVLNNLGWKLFNILFPRTLESFACFLTVLTFWLTVLFTQFGLLAPRNWTAMSALFICAISMSGAIFLILELNQPLEGTIKVSSAPLHKAFSLIGK